MMGQDRPEIVRVSRHAPKCLDHNRLFRICITDQADGGGILSEDLTLGHSPDRSSTLNGRRILRILSSKAATICSYCRLGGL